MKENQFDRQRKPSRAQKSVINNRFVYGTFTQSKIGVKDKPLRHNIICFLPVNNSIHCFASLSSSFAISQSFTPLESQRSPFHSFFR